ncbi:probable sulfotransferase [Hahella chejuensis KCTC 2396]|uniref:Probable sulfotransferase n=1 Tax=Hahella chejuensis (strain KCTC 2396) TaxID=349521 RepID=Q2SGP1_HAHCH|nr:sulfotransferase domain-containing protein [Hahella chejuensis]ABC30183.1 probable sulfotransferase [Hahella chejuensis KCTC 2396]
MDRSDRMVYGLRVPYFITESRINELMQQVEPRNTDVWLVTYPRSGTTLTQGILANLLNADASRHQTVPWPEVGWENSRYYISLDDLEKLVAPRCFKSHWTASEHVDPIKSKARFIHVSRDCPDMVTSYYYQYLNAIDGDKSYRRSWDDFFQQFMTSELRWGSYFYHYYSWRRHYGRSNILYLTYEEILSDMPTAVRKIADFVGVDVTERDVQRITEACRFAAMKAREPEMAHHYRVGAIGDHRRVMSEAQINSLTHKMNEVKAMLQFPGDKSCAAAGRGRQALTCADPVVAGKSLQTK